MPFFCAMICLSDKQAKANRRGAIVALTGVKKGDRVRITWEATTATASVVDQSGGILVSTAGHSAYVPAEAVEILEPPVKVGDIVKGKALEALPTGSLISWSDDDPRPHLLRTRSGWVNTEGESFSASAAKAPRILLHIPAAQ